MLSKQQIQNNFYGSRFDYENNAEVQKIMADKLCRYLENAYGNVLEIGCGLGTLTQKLLGRIRFGSYHAIDLMPEYQEIFAEKFPDVRYAAYDMDNTAAFLPSLSFDLIVGNACIQWSENPARLIRTLHARLSRGGTLALSFFGQENFKEIREIFHAGLTYLTAEEIGEIRRDFPSAEYREETYVLSFDSPIDALRHIKKTGVGSMLRTCLKKSQLQAYTEKFQNRLTYQPAYLVIKKR